MMGLIQENPPESDTNEVFLSELYRSYALPLRQFFLRKKLSESDVADLIQDVFTRLCAKSDLESISNSQNYIFVAAANALRDRARRSQSREFHNHVSLDEMELPSSECSPLRVLVGQEGVDQLLSALTQLPERTRDIFILKTFEDMRLADVARLHSISKRAAEKHFAKAMVHIEQSTRGYGEA